MLSWIEKFVRHFMMQAWLYCCSTLFSRVSPLDGTPTSWFSVQAWWLLWLPVRPRIERAPLNHPGLELCLFVFVLNLLFSLWCVMNGSAWPFPMSGKVLGRVQQLWRLQNFCSQLVLALCRDSERVRDPSAGVAAAVDDALSLTQAERRRREMQRPVKLCESKFWNLCPMKWFFSWSLDTEHGLFFSLYRLGPLQKCVHKQ